MQFNLSEWALGHRSFVVYCMIAVMVAGVMSYYRLGRNEDPAFTFRTMIVQAAWPGATLERHARSGDRADRAQAPGDAESRLPAQLHERRHHDDIREPEGSTPARNVPDIWYRVRKNVGDIRQHLAGRRRRARLQRRVRRHLRDHLRLHCGRVHAPRASRLRREHPRAAVARDRCLQDRGSWRSGRKDHHRILDREARRFGHRSRLVDRLRFRRRTRSARPAALQTGDEKLALRVSGAFDSELDILASTSSRTDA